MRFPPSLLDEIKARLPPSVVVGRRVRLVKAGREWKGLSPFGKEKTPSFFVNDVKQAWFDFSSGRNGDIFKFLMETEGVSFPEAVERLAAEAGVALPVESEDSRWKEEVRRGLYEIIELAAAFFEAELAGPRGGAARAYLAGRSLIGEPARRFRIGYAPPDRFALRDHLAQKGVDVPAMIEAGLLIHGEDIAVPYDRFRDRVMFPIADARGRVVAFGGRAMSAEAQAKYLNTADTALFHKGRLLYNHHAARKAAHASGRVVAVEGYVDVIAMTEAGFAETVAPLGTALTEEQLALLWRMSPEPILCFDGDKAGRKAAYRAIDAALPLMTGGQSLRFALLPEGKDPDELFRSGGREAVEAAIAAAIPLVDLIWTRETEAVSLDTPERRAAFERRLGEVTRSIADEATRRHYDAEMRGRLAALFPAAPARGPRGRGQGWRPGEPRRGSYPPQRGAGGIAFLPVAKSASLARSPLFNPAPGEHPREAFVLLGLAAHPALIAEFADELAEMDWQGQAAVRICQALLQCVLDTADSAVADARGDLGGALADDLPVAAVLAAPLAADAMRRLGASLPPSEARQIRADADREHVRRAIRQGLVLHRRARTLHSELRAAERAFSEDASEAHLEWLRDVKARLQSVEGTEAIPE